MEYSSIEDKSARINLNEVVIFHLEPTQLYSSNIKTTMSSKTKGEVHECLGRYCSGPTVVVPNTEVHRFECNQGIRHACGGRAANRVGYSTLDDVMASSVSGGLGDSSIKATEEL